MEDAEWWPAMGERMRLIRGALNLSEEAAAEACQVSLKTGMRPAHNNAPGQS
jgi:hypothetical protein